MTERPNTALILEGGALRGVYTSGVLDVLMLHHVKIPNVVGISAGSLNGLFYVSGQIGNAAELNLNYVRDSRYMSFSNLARQRNFFNFDFVFHDIFHDLIPFDFEPIYEEACLRIQEDLSAGFTSVINLGSPDYFEALYQDALISLYNDDSLDQRFFGSYMMNRPLLPKGLVRKLMERKTICNEIDGMIGAEMLNIRLDKSSAPISFSMHALEQILTEAADKGFKIYISAAGSGDVELALNGLEHIRSKGFKNPFTIESVHDPAMFSEQFIYSQTCIYIDPAVLRGECTTEEYLSALTLTASEAAGLDNCAGSIEKGKYADMLVYSTDPMDMSPGQLMESGPDMVIINGKIVSSSMMEVVK